MCGLLWRIQEFAKELRVHLQHDGVHFEDLTDNLELDVLKYCQQILLVISELRVSHINGKVCAVESVQDRKEKPTAVYPGNLKTIASPGGSCKRRVGSAILATCRGDAWWLLDVEIWNC